MREAAEFKRVIGLDLSLLVLSKSVIDLNYSALRAQPHSSLVEFTSPESFCSRSGLFEGGLSFR